MPKLKILIPAFIFLLLVAVFTAFILFNNQHRKNEVIASNTLSFDDGSQFTGDIKNDKANGQGVLSFKNGDTYEGQFKDNLFEGQGVYTWSNGDKYIGEFKKGKFHGKGKYIHSDGTVEEGNWINDVLIE